MHHIDQVFNTPNANTCTHVPVCMVVPSIAAWDEFYGSEASEASVFCFDNASPEKSCFIVDRICFISLCQQVVVFLNATCRRE